MARTGLGSSLLARSTILVVAALATVGCGSTHRAPKLAAPPAQAKSLRGLVPTPLPRAPSFTLTDTGGHPFAFAARTHGKLAYLYFGYTHCPDACPLTMADIAAALRRVRPDVRRRVEVVFVSVDPHRDTPRVLRAWLDHYNHAFIGLTGTERAVRAAAQDAGVPLPPAPQNQQGAYGVTHSSFVLPFSPDGRAHVVYTQGFHAADFAHDMPLLLAM